MNAKPPTGPKSTPGKKMSSRNAISHGLTAKTWLNPAEQESYQLYLSALNEDYQPQTVMEHTLIEKLADIKTKLERFHTVEDSLFSLAQTQATSPDTVINSFNLEGEDIIDDIRNHALGIARSDNSISDDLFFEIIRHDEEDISGWGYIRDNMPRLSAHIIEECRKENIDIESLMNRYKPASNDSLAIEIIYINNKQSETMTEQALDESGLKVRSQYFINYIKGLYKKTQHRLLVNTVIKDFDSREKLLTKAALPDGQTLDRVMRYRNTLERQFSKTLGELLLLIKMRQG